ncbi:MAG: flagellar assembly peptidoglycan hydrolase FlgJ [Pseudomonadota bacterium]
MSAYPTSVYTDFQGIAALKYQARQDQAGSLEKVAKQFESLFVQMMVKQMRQASFGGGVFDSDRSRFYQDMYDQQISLHLSESGGMGIGAMLRRQLGQPGEPSEKSLSGLDGYRESPVMPAIRTLLVQTKQDSEAPERPEAITGQSSQSIESPQQFVESLWSSAERAATSIGLPAEALLAQAALETGWGGHVMSATSGNSSHNLFGIKADQRWEGERVRRETLEYESGVAVRRREAFRAYGSYEESFQDYVAFLKGSPKYAEALENTHDSQAYFSRLQQAGYATDPKYAEKIQRVMQGPEMQSALQKIKDDAYQAI